LTVSQGKVSAKKVRRENKNTRQWPILLVINVPKIVVNGLVTMLEVMWR